MNFRALTPEDIEIFSEAISNFFNLMTRQPAQVKTAYVFQETAPIIWNDFNGVIQVSGGFRGSIAFSAPRGLLNEILIVMGESGKSDAHFLDVVGEIANQLSGRARRHFGEALDISTPISCERAGFPLKALAEGPAYAIPLTWGPYEANLVVHLDLAKKS